MSDIVIDAKFHGARQRNNNLQCGFEHCKKITPELTHQFFFSEFRKTEDKATIDFCSHECLMKHRGHIPHEG